MRKNKNIKIFITILMVIIAIFIFIKETDLKNDEIYAYNINQNSNIRYI